MSHSLSHSIVWQQKQKLLQWEQPYWEFSCNKIQYVSTEQKIQFTLMQFKTVRFSFIYIAQIHNSSHLGAFYILSKLQYYEEKTIIFFEVKGWQERHLGLGCTVAQKATWKHSNPQSTIFDYWFQICLKVFPLSDWLWLQCLRSCLQPYKQKTHWHVCRGLSWLIVSVFKVLSFVKYTQFWVLGVCWVSCFTMIVSYFLCIMFTLLPLPHYV